MPPKSEDSPIDSAREEAKRTLDRVLRRYGIHPDDQQGSGQERAAAAPRVHPEIVATEPDLSKAPSSRVRQPQLNPPMDLGWRRYKKQAAVNKTLSQNEPADGAATDRVCWDIPRNEQPLQFHYMIRILECAVTLHCQVTAQNASEAKEYVEQIPNLIEWREISEKEVAEIRLKQTW